MNITRRNLLGGFLGGLFGILMFGYFHWGGLPLGCLLGVIIGWYHYELGVSVLSVFSSSHKASRKTMVLGLEQELSGIKDAFAKGREKLKKEGGVERVRHDTILTAVTTAEIVVWAIFWTCCFVFLYCHGYFTVVEPMNRVLIIEQAVVDGFAVVMCIISIMAIVLIFGDEFANPLAWKNSGEELYKKMGAISFAFRSFLWLIIMHVLVTYVVACVCLGWFLSFLVAALSVPFWVLRMTFKGSGHLPCLIITLTVTFLSAWMMHSWITNSLGCWLVAFFTGMVSGGLAAGYGYSVRTWSWFTLSPKQVYNKLMDHGLTKWFVCPFKALEPRIQRLTGIVT